MQPNNQQGSPLQPGSGQPLQPQPPVAPVSPVSPPAPATPIALQPIARTVAPTATSVHAAGIAPVVDPAALQAALNEPAPGAAPVPDPTPAQNPAPAQTVDPQGLVADDQTVDLNDPEYAEGDEEYDLSEEPVTWAAHEFIHREKGTLWFFLFAIIIAALIAVSIFTQAWSFTVLIVVVAIVVVVFTRRPPRELTYSLTDEGLTIDGDLHKFSAFKSFGIIHDGEEFSVMLIPTQRFQPGIAVYFPEEAGEDIVDVLGSRLPMKDLKLDIVDRAVRLLRL